MSAGAVFQQALRILTRLGLPGEASADLVRALEAGRTGPLPLLYEAGAEAGLAHEDLVERAGAIFLGFCAGNLCDDLIDGEADWLGDPARLGPSAQFVLQNASFAALLDAGLPAEAVARAAKELARAGSWSHVEQRTTRWDRARYQAIGSEIAGRQYVAWFQLLWHGTRLEPVAAEFGRAAAIAGHVAQDVATDDPRFFSMGEEDRAAVLAWARDAADDLARHDLRTARLLLAWLGPQLRDAA